MFKVEGGYTGERIQDNGSKDSLDFEAVNKGSPEEGDDWFADMKRIK